MEYRRFGDRIVARIDRGEEVVSSIEKIAKAESIKLGKVSALGALGDFTVGVYKVSEQKYYPNHFTGDFEIVSLFGTICTKEGEYYGHFHLSAGDGEGRVFGGHLNEGIISATCEMVIDIIDGQVERQVDSDTGLNIYKFL